jgi:putative tryptophan/tyrosine transport system substrate-binding protein
VNGRTFLRALGVVSLAAAPLAGEAQQAQKVPRIGVLGTSPTGVGEVFPAFRKGLQELGYVEGQHVHLDYRGPKGGPEGYPILAAQLVQSRSDVILAISGPAALAAKQATDTVPIVFCTMGDDPVRLGIVASLARPGGNATGTVILSRELEGKRLELLKEALPGLSRAAVLWKASVPTHPSMLQNIEEAARRLNIGVIPVEWKGPGDVEKAFQLARRERVGGVLALPSPETWRARTQIARVALEHRLPTVGSEPGFVAAGNLVQYGPDLSESCHRAAFYVDRILKGAKPADLPVEQPTRFSLAINMKTAKALGLTIPQSLLLRADEVIQ